MKTLYFYLASLLILGTFLSCSSPVSYDSDYQTAYDFSQLHSYAWLTDEPFIKHRAGNDIVDKRLLKAINNTLQSKNYDLTSSSSPDFYVNYSVTKEDKVDIRTYNTYSGYAPGFRYYPWGMGVYPSVGYGYNMPYTEPETRMVHYVQGTLVIDILVAQTKQIVWRGTAAGKLGQQDLTPEERNELINEIVSEVLSEFPPTKR